METPVRADRQYIKDGGGSVKVAGDGAGAGASAGAGAAGLGNSEKDMFDGLEKEMVGRPQPGTRETTSLPCPTDCLCEPRDTRSNYHVILKLTLGSRRRWFD